MWQYTSDIGALKHGEYWLSMNVKHSDKGNNNNDNSYIDSNKK